MKKILWSITVVSLLIVSSGFAYASGRYDDRPWRREHHRDSGAFYGGGGYPGVSISFSFPVTYYEPYRRHYRPPRRVWVPGHWERMRAWAPGRTERHWGPGRHGPYGRHNFGNYGERRHRGEYRMQKVWREGRYR